MIILRIWDGAIDHFPVRRSEWINTFAMGGWAAITLSDDRGLLGPWTMLGKLANETFWVFLFITLSLIRLIVLTVNGTFPKSWYGRWAPHARVATALLATLAWFQLFMACVYSWPTTGIIAYGAFFVSDALNTLSASAEARELDKGRRDVAAATTGVVDS